MIMIRYLNECPGVYTVGRDSECDIVINDFFVNKKHMQLIVTDDGELYCVDLDSRNGTYVNGVRITGKTHLNKPDVIKIGKTTLRMDKFIGNNKPLKKTWKIF